MKIQLKRSNVLANGAAKAPTAPQMEFGELAVNYNTADPVIFIKDSSGAIIRLTNDNTSIDQEIVDINDKIVDINDKIIVIEGDISSIKGDITTIQDDITPIQDDIKTIQGDISTINDSISAIETDIAVLPDPLEGTTHQPGTLDMRYVSRFSWSNIPVLA